MEGQQTDQGKGGRPEGQPPAPADLDLLNELDDSSKDEAELWAEADAEDAAAAGNGDGSDDARDGAQSDADQEAAAAAAEASAAAAEAAKTDDSAEGDGGDSPDGQGRHEAKDGQPSGQEDQGGKADPWASVPAELRDAHRATEAELDALRKKEDGHRRHISGLTRKLREFEDGTARPKPAEVKTDSDDALKQLEADYAEFAPLIQEFRELRKENAELKQSHQQDRTESFLDQQQSILTGAHSDWLDVTAEEPFAEWIADQPGYVQKVIADNAKQIVDAEAAADIIGRYKAFRSSQAQQGDGAGADQGGDSPGQGSDQQTGNDDLSKRRARQRQSASSARSTGAGPATGISDDGDEEAIWKAMDAQERREAAHGSR